MVNQPIAGGGWVATHEDVTELRKSEKEIAETRHFLELVIDNVPAAISVKDAKELRYILINRAGEEIYGIPRERMIGKTINELFSDRPAAVISVARPPGAGFAPAAGIRRTYVPFAPSRRANPSVAAGAGAR